MERQQRTRTNSIIEIDTEFIRPRYTLVFSLAAIFILIVLNVSFWYNYLEVIIWAVAASQLIRPLTVDIVKATSKVRDARLKNKKRSILMIFYENVIKRAPEEIEETASSKDRAKSSSRSSTDTKPFLGLIEEVADFVFTNPTVFLTIVMASHLMPLHVFLILFGTLVILLVMFSVAADVSGFTDAALKLLVRPSVVSTVVIGGLIIALVFVDLSILIATFFEFTDLTYKASNLLSQFLETLSSDSHAAVVTSLSPNVLWAKENALQLYDTSSHQFGKKKWWSVVESLKTSIENRVPPERMARAAMDQLRLVYNETEWIGLVEMAVMAAVPEKKRVETQRFTALSLQMIWLSVGETLWRFSALFVDTFKFLSLIAGQLFLFVFIVQQMCKSSRDVITCVCIFTCPASSKARNQLNADLQTALRNSFTDALFSAHKSALVVLIVYGVLGMPCAFISTTFVYLTSILHIIPELWSLLAISLPWLVFQVFSFYVSLARWDDYWAWFDLARAALLPVLLIELNLYANRTWLYKTTRKSKLVSPWLLDFSLAVGIGHFGMDGIILGPFLASVSSVVLDFVIRIAEQDLDLDDEFILKKRQSQLGLNEYFSQAGAHRNDGEREDDYIQLFKPANGGLNGVPGTPPRYRNDSSSQHLNGDRTPDTADTDRRYQKAESKEVDDHLDLASVTPQSQPTTMNNPSSSSAAATGGGGDGATRSNASAGKPEATPTALADNSPGTLSVTSVVSSAGRPVRRILL